MNPAPLKPQISLEDLERIDIRVGTIESVGDVSESDKLVRLRVSFGDHVRTILVGMKGERAQPKELEGRQALFVVNMSPRRMAGVLSRRYAAGHRIRGRHLAGAGRARDARPGRLPGWLMRAGLPAGLIGPSHDRLVRVRYSG